MVRQVVPRPPWARRVDAVPGAGGPGGPAGAFTMGAVRQAFRPGAPGPGAGPATAGAGAAVLIALMPEDGRGGESQASVVLIRRAAHLRANPGEIAFPGGRIEPGEMPLQAALREAEEEVGLSPDGLEVLGELSSLGHPLGAAPIVPFVAAAASRLSLEANPDEVDSVLCVPLASLVAPGRYWRERWDRAGDPPRTMHFFDLGEDVVWGATAEMLHALFLRLTGGV
ncbi:MAG: NUDIX hydrolase [Acidimicrobiales bacterium]